MSLPLTSAAFYLIAFLFFLWLALLLWKPKKKDETIQFASWPKREFKNTYTVVGVGDYEPVESRELNEFDKERFLGGKVVTFKELCNRGVSFETPGPAVPLPGYKEIFPIRRCRYCSTENEGLNCTSCGAPL